MKFRPLHDRVVIRRLDAEEKTKGGIIIPDTAKEKPHAGQGHRRRQAGKRRRRGRKGHRAARRQGRRHASSSASTRAPRKSSSMVRTYLIMREEEILGVMGNSLASGPATAKPAALDEDEYEDLDKTNVQRPANRRTHERSRHHVSQSRSAYGEEVAPGRILARRRHQLANAVKVTLGPKGRNVVHRQEASVRPPGSPRTA